MEKEKTTDMLTSVLRRTRPEEASEVLKAYRSKLALGECAFSEYVRGIIRENKLRQKDVFLKADIPERYGYKLVSGEKTTQRRDVLLRLFLAAGFDLNQVQHALRLYGMPELYSRFERDAVLIIAVNSGMSDPYDVDELLEGQGLEPLLPCGTEE